MVCSTVREHRFWTNYIGLNREQFISRCASSGILVGKPSKLYVNKLPKLFLVFKNILPLISEGNNTINETTVKDIVRMVKGCYNLYVDRLKFENGAEFL